MLLWLVYLPLSFIVSILCYVTNPLVVLFCDDDGELPDCLQLFPLSLSLWQTWDNSCNPSDVQEIFPEWLQYNWANHYTEHRGSTPELRKVNRERWFTKCFNPDFTLAERIKRYICRVLWLSRNCSYGFAFWWFGLTPEPYFDYIINEPRRCFVRELCGGNVAGAWKYTDSRDIFSLCGYTLRWNVFLGWKLATEEVKPTRAAIANRIAFKIVKEGA